MLLKINMTALEAAEVIAAVLVLGITMITANVMVLMSGSPLVTMIW
jgi:hypothetical protein